MTGARAGRGERGTALVAALAILLAVFVLVALLAQTIGRQARLVRRLGARSQAFYLAESGIDLAVGELEGRDAPPESLELDGELGSGTFEARAERVPMPGRGLALDIVTGRGECRGVPVVVAERGVLGRHGFVSLDFREGNPPSSWRDGPGGR